MAIGRLNDYQLQQGMRRMVFSGKTQPPTLPEFVKLCRTVGHDDTIPDAPPANPLPRLTHDDGFDKWALEANKHLFAHVLRCLSKMRTFDAYQTGILLNHRDRWAEIMRKCDSGEGVDVEDQQEIWHECMRMADEDMAKRAAA